MDSNPFIILLLGMCIMFFGMMTWLFWRKGDQLRRIISVLMCVVATCYAKDFITILLLDEKLHLQWTFFMATDMLAIPLYTCVLRELIKPGTASVKQLVLNEIPFLILPILLLATGHYVFFWINVGWGTLFGCYYMIWGLVMIPRYDASLREHFSYTENINLGWLRVTLWTFVVLLCLWMLDYMLFGVEIECIYMVLHLIIWVFICFLIYRHESVIGELGGEAQPIADILPDQTLDARIKDLFYKKKAYLNPRLKLSDVARDVGTNRTYVSNYFNQTLNVTFYDYVNKLRIEYACQLLKTTSDSLNIIAEESGFRSRSTFHRAFFQLKGLTQAQFRQEQ